MTPEQAKEHLQEVAASGIVTRTPKYVEIQLDLSTWDALQDWKIGGAPVPSARPSLAATSALPQVVPNASPEVTASVKPTTISEPAAAAPSVEIAEGALRQSERSSRG